MSFSDIFKTNFLEQAKTFSITDMCISLGLSFIVGLFIFFIYKKTFNGVMYSSGFGLSLIIMTMITSLVILAVTSNVVLSLGMVGALSIVRFRTAIKEPMDIAFLFWAIAVGIVLGAGLIALAITGSVFIGLILLLFANKKSNDQPYLLIVNCSNDDAEDNVLNVLKSGVKKYRVKTKTVSENGIELTLEVRLKEQTSKFVNMVSSANGVSNAVLVSYNGEYMS